jgi:FkbM family methyltransferase
MLIKQEVVIALLKKHNIKCTGALHIGAHECEELGFYDQLGISRTNIVWIDAIDAKVKQATDRGIPNVFKAVITDKDNDTVKFNHTNNGQSSSILEFGTHATEHPDIKMIHSTQETTITLDTFLKEKQIDPTLYDFWNFDIQGAELMALKGGIQALQYAKVLYLEVNVNELYKGCALIGEIDEFLKGYGFTRVITDMTQYGWGDAVYLKSNSLP